MQYRNWGKAAESMELLALRDLFDAAPGTTRHSLGLEQKKVGEARLFAARNTQSILLNRVVGLGVDEPASAKQILRIRDYYAAAGIRDYFLHIQPWAMSAGAWGWLFEAGLKQDRGWTQFVRDTGFPPEHKTALRVAPIGADLAQEFGRIAADGFGLGELAVDALAALVGRPGWHHFMSFQDDQPAGVGAMRVSQGTAWLDWAATDPRYRGMGSQSALLSRRIQTARELGCKQIFSETGEAVPGDPQHSFHNLVRAGFRATYTRENFAPIVSPNHAAELSSVVG